MTREGTVDEDEGRALLAAYLPATEPLEPPVTAVVARARAVRRRRRTVLASAASVVAVLVGAAAVGVGPDRAAGPPAAPGPAAPDPAWPTLPPDYASRAGVPSPTLEPGCEDQNRSNDPAAKALAAWVRGKLAGRRPQAGPAEWIRMCEIDFGYGLVSPPHVMHHANFSLPLAGGVTGTDSLTAVAERWERLPAQYRTPCRDDVITEHVRCEQRRLPDGSLLVRRDFFDILIQGDPGDPAAKRDKHAVRDVSRIFPDRRVVSVGLAYNMQPAWKQSFDRHVLSLDQLAAIVTDPGALRHFPAP